MLQVRFIRAYVAPRIHTSAPLDSLRSEKKCVGNNGSISIDTHGSGLNPQKGWPENVFQIHVE